MVGGSLQRSGETVTVSPFTDTEGAGFVALAPDLYHGELAEHHEMDKAGELMNKLVAEVDKAAPDMSGAVTALL